MGIFLEDANLEIALFTLLGFFALAFLGRLFVQLLLWDSVVREYSPRWLQQLRRQGRQLRTIRRLVEKLQNMPAMPLPSSWRKKWQVFRWITTAISAAKWARS